jgi:nucleotide-binding universal stress UspA family protein
MWQLILVGVDDSTASANAAALGWQLAGGNDARCVFVHAARDVWSTVRNLTIAAAGTASASPLGDDTRAGDSLLATAESRMRTWLASVLEPGADSELHVGMGRAAAVVEAAAADVRADLVVLGGKEHSAWLRVFGGSTAHHVARSLNVPLLVVASPPVGVRRILAAVDLTDAAGATIRAAETLAQLTGAQVRIVHAVAAIPEEPERQGAMTQEDFYAMSARILEDLISPQVTLRDAESRVRQGDAEQVIRKEVANWQPDVLVIGTHGRSWANRILLGSVTEALLSHLPTTTLFVPPPSGEQLD